MIERTVIGWDGSAGAVEALDWALRRPSTETLVLVRVDNDVALQETFAANSPAAAARVGLMEKADEIRKQHPGRTVHSELVQGDTATALAAFSHSSSLVVVGTRHPAGKRARRSWSVGAKVAGTAPGPVAVIPQRSGAEGNSIVVGVDDPEEAALLFAAEEAAASGKVLRPVRAWQEPPSWSGRTESDGAERESLAAMYRDLVFDAIESLSERFPDLRIEPLIEQGEPADVLLAAAQSAAMLVVGNRGFHRVKRFFLGSVSQGVVLAASVPTVVVNGPSAR